MIWKWRLHYLEHSRWHFHLPKHTWLLLTNHSLQQCAVLYHRPNTMKSYYCIDILTSITLKCKMTYFPFCAYMKSRALPLIQYRKMKSPMPCRSILVPPNGRLNFLMLNAAGPCIDSDTLIIHSYMNSSLHYNYIMLYMNISTCPVIQTHSSDLTESRLSVSCALSIF